MSQFTGNKDTDFLILMKLSDTDLNAVCGVNRYVKKLCESELFWRNRLFKNEIIAKLEKEFIEAEYPDNYFIDMVNQIKNFLEFEKMKDFYLFLMNAKKEFINIRECFVRFDQKNQNDKTQEKLFAYIQNIPYPSWINPQIFQRTLKRDYFLGFGRADGKQGRLRIDGIENDFNKIIRKLK